MIHYSGDTKATLLNKLDESPQVPGAVSRAIRDILAVILEGAGINVMAAGHVDGQAGLVEIKVHMLNVL